MKKISEHLGQILVVLAGIVLLVSVLSMFSAPVSAFFGSVTDTLVEKGANMLDSIDTPEAGEGSSGGGAGGTDNYEIIEGDGQEINKNIYVPLRFKSNADYTKFDSVKVDGVEVDSSNYVTSEGSTVVTFNSTYSAALSTGNHTIEIISTDGSASGAFSVVDSNVIPAGATFTVESTGAVLEAGNSFPDTVNEDDIYVYEHYKYKYSPDNDGWRVFINTDVVDKTQTSYGPILESINGIPVTSLYQTFQGCSNLIESPVIPSTVKEMKYAFRNCHALKHAPNIPLSVTSLFSAFSVCYALEEIPELHSNITDFSDAFAYCTSLKTATIPVGATTVYRMYDHCTGLERVVLNDNYPGLSILNSTFSGCTSLTSVNQIPSGLTSLISTFSGCTSLTTAPTIPSSVTKLQSTFSGCPALAGNIEVNADPSDGYNNFLKGIDFNVQNLTLVGSSTMLDVLGGTGTNYCADCNGTCSGSH